MAMVGEQRERDDGIGIIIGRARQERKYAVKPECVKKNNITRTQSFFNPG